MIAPFAVVPSNRAILRIIRVPWYIAVPLVLLALDPDKNFWPAMTLLILGAVMYYGTVLVRWWMADDPAAS